MTKTTVPKHQDSTGFSSKPPPPFRNLSIQVYSHWFLKHNLGSPKKSLTTFFFLLMEAPERAGFIDMVAVPLEDEKILLFHCRYPLCLIFIWNMLGFPT